ncbi:MAG TPA: DUF308 domain-containing protein [Acidimicrobiales bacterium]|nr:DUF308 domain-containing protein [Acidimicrobiales bacterium]
MAVRGGVAAGEPDEARWWWVRLLTGLIWLLFGFAILNGHDEISTVWTVAVFAGVMFAAIAISEFLTAGFVESWRWLHVLLGVASGIAAICAFAWPGQTFLTLAAIMGWYLLATGVLHIAIGFNQKGFEDLWWSAVLVGVVEILLGFWAIGYPGRSIKLLVLWITMTALARGLLEVVNAFSLRSARRGPTTSGGF